LTSLNGARAQADQQETLEGSEPIGVKISGTNQRKVWHVFLGYVGFSFSRLIVSLPLLRRFRAYMYRYSIIAKPKRKTNTLTRLYLFDINTR
jgi:hypothetical protein